MQIEIPLETQLIQYVKLQKAVLVNDAKYYWVNPNLIAFIVDAEPGSWGPGAQPTSEAMKALFDLSDISTQVANETWMGAREGTDNFNLAR